MSCILNLQWTYLYMNMQWAYGASQQWVPHRTGMKSHQHCRSLAASELWWCCCLLSGGRARMMHLWNTLHHRRWNTLCFRSDAHDRAACDVRRTSYPGSLGCRIGRRHACWIHTRVSSITWVLGRWTLDLGWFSLIEQAHTSSYLIKDYKKNYLNKVLTI